MSSKGSSNDASSRQQQAERPPIIFVPAMADNESSSRDQQQWHTTPIARLEQPCSFDNRESMHSSIGRGSSSGGQQLAQGGNREMLSEQLSSSSQQRLPESMIIGSDPAVSQGSHLPSSSAEGVLVANSTGHPPQAAAPNGSL